MLRRSLINASAALALTLGASLTMAAAALGAPAAKRIPHRPPRVPKVAIAPSRTGPNVSVTMPPVGLSLEYPLMSQDLGAEACPPPALSGELRRLGSPPLALSGNSQDLTAPTGALAGATPNWQTATLFELPSGFWSRMRCLLGASPDPLTVGLNLKTGSPAWASQLVTEAQGAAAPATPDFSLGNEPDLYPFPNHYALGMARTAASPEAASLYVQLTGAFQPAIGTAPVIGPEMAAARHWQAQYGQVVSALHAHVVGAHMYPLSACRDPHADTVERLLSPSAGEEPRGQAWIVAAADAAKVPAIVSEANSVSCGGTGGVSDRPAAAVWAIRFVLSALKTGFREVRFHFSGGAYDPFVVAGQQVSVRPIEPALASLNQWLPVGSTLASVRSAPGLVVTALHGSPAAPQLLIDNEQGRAVDVVLPATHTTLAEVLSPARTGFHAVTLRPRHGRIELGVQPNCVVALLASP